MKANEAILALNEHFLCIVKGNLRESTPTLTEMAEFIFDDKVFWFQLLK